MHFSAKTIIAFTLASCFSSINAAPMTQGTSLTSRAFNFENIRSVLAERDAETVFTDTGSIAVTLNSTLNADSSDSTTTSAITAAGAQDGADVADAVAGTLDKIVQYVQGLVDKDIARRQIFTQKVVAQIRSQFPNDNVVMSNVGYDFTGTPISKTSTSYKAKVGSNVSYDVLVFTTGTFTLKGDGGYENWAYIINSACTASGKTFTC